MRTKIWTAGLIEFQGFEDVSMAGWTDYYSSPTTRGVRFVGVKPVATPADQSNLAWIFNPSAAALVLGLGAVVGGWLYSTYFPRGRGSRR